MTTTNIRLKELFEKEHIDLYDYIMISLNDGYCDYCQSDTQVRRLMARIRRYMSVSALITKIEDSEQCYFHILPVKMYKRFGGKDQLIRGMCLGLLDVPNYYKLVFTGSEEYPCNIVLKNYGEDLDIKGLLNVIELTNKQNS